MNWKPIYPARRRLTAQTQTYPKNEYKQKEEAVARINRSGKPGGSGDSCGIPADADSRAARLAVLQGVTVQEAEERAQSFVSSGRMKITTEALKRSLTLTSGNIAQPTRVSGINAGQNIVSGIVDMVRVVDADGMGEDSVAYEVSGGQTAAAKRDDSTAANATDPVLRVAKITPTMISTLSLMFPPISSARRRLTIRVA